MSDEKIVIELNEIFETFSEEMERKIQLKEFFCLIIWSLKNVPFKTFNGGPVTDIEGIKVVLKSGSEKINATNVVGTLGELNDNCFVAAMDFVAELAKDNVHIEEYELAIQSIFNFIISALQKFDYTPFEDRDKNDVTKVDVKFTHQKKIRIKQGDVISIPLSDTSFALALMIVKNSFGTGYGIFDKRYAAFTFKELASNNILKYQLFTIDEPIENGKWKILFNDKNLLSRFPKNIEKFHSPLLVDTAKPYGLGETTDGTLRKLSKEEAEEIGISSEDFEQVLLPEEMEDYLNRKL